MTDPGSDVQIKKANWTENQTDTNWSEVCLNTLSNIGYDVRYPNFFAYYFSLV